MAGKRPSYPARLEADMAHFIIARQERMRTALLKELEPALVDGQRLDGKRFKADPSDPLVGAGRVVIDTQRPLQIVEAQRRAAAVRFGVSVRQLTAMATQLDLFVTRNVRTLLEPIAKVATFARVEVAQALDAWVTRNVDLIVTVDRRFFKGVEDAVKDGAQAGLRAEQIAAQLHDTTIPGPARTANFNAWRIARDQMGKLHADITQQRFARLGVGSYRWSSSRDERVRDEHVELDGKVFSVGVGAPGEGNPGEPIMCRCVAIPILPGEPTEDIVRPTIRTRGSGRGRSQAQRLRAGRRARRRSS